MPYLRRVKMVPAPEFINPDALQPALGAAKELLLPKGRHQEDYQSFLKLAGVEIETLSDIGGEAYNHTTKGKLRITIQRDEAIPWMVDRGKNIVGFGCHHHFEEHRFNHPSTNLQHAQIGRVEDARFALAAYRPRLPVTRRLWENKKPLVVGTENNGMIHSLFAKTRPNLQVFPMPAGTIELGGRIFSEVDAVLIIKQLGRTSDHHDLVTFQDGLSPIFHNFYWKASANSYQG